MAMFANNYFANQSAPRDPLSIAGIMQRGLPTSQQQMMSGITQLMQDPRQGQMMDAEQRAMKPGFFGKGGSGRNILGAISDGLSVAGGGNPYYMQMMQHQKAQEQEDAQRMQERQQQMEDYQRQREDSRSDWQDREQWKIDHQPPPEAPDWMSYVQAMTDPNTPPEQRQFIQQYVLKGNSPDIMGQRLNNQVQLKTTAPASSGGGGGRAAPKGVFTVKSQGDYARLQSGTKYVAPDGSVRIKQ